jgi:hypothetical protein
MTDTSTFLAPTVTTVAATTDGSDPTIFLAYFTAFLMISALFQHLLKQPHQVYLIELTYQISLTAPYLTDL